MTVRTIHKFRIEPGTQRLHVGYDPKPLSVQMQGTDMCLWASFALAHLPAIGNPRDLAVTVVGTGCPFTDDGADAFVGTVQHEGFVWHVFARQA